MREYLPILIVGAIIGSFSLAFVLAYFALQKSKEKFDDNERHMADKEIIRRLLAYAKPYWKNFVAVFFVMLFSIVYDLISPLLIGHIQDTIKGEFELSYLFSMVGVYAGILVVSLICTYLQAMILQKTGQKILSQLRRSTSIRCRLVAVMMLVPIRSAVRRAVMVRVQRIILARTMVRVVSTPLTTMASSIRTICVVMFR